MQINVNGKRFIVDEQYRNRNLLDWLRNDLLLTGTKDGCGAGFCGSCSIIIDGNIEKACQLTLSEVAGKAILTIEGLSEPNGALHPLQQAFIDHGAVQCGYCIPGMILTAHVFLQKEPSPTREAIRKAISPNLCRCTGYQQIVDAIEAASESYQ
ncbi:MAG: (2Fe-2S)-binding protein [bacterium]|nr:(2Fe-2S)-binding protein [bacterium]